jgi:predicted ribosomally synthesized peptide with nif11-like leader
MIALPASEGRHDGWPQLSALAAMALDQLKAFLARMQADEALKGQVLAAATADDVAQIALKLGFEFSGDELLRVSGQRFDRVTVRKNDIPGEYN